MILRPKLHEGMTLWWVPANRYRDPSEVSVIKAGRVWAQLSNQQRADIKTWAVDSGGYAPGGRIWASRDAYEADAALQSAWSDFRSDVSRRFSAPPGMSVERINQIRADLGLEVLNKEPRNAG